MIKQIRAMVKRNTKLFFNDKGLFFTSLITPVILLVLYIAFLGNIYENSFLMSLPEGFTVDNGIVKGYVGGQLISSVLAVSSVTVAFSSNMLMVQDKFNGSLRDLSITPTSKTVYAISYYIASLISTLIVCFVLAAICLVYVGFIGFYLSFADILLMILDVVMLAMLGTALSSVINFFLSNQGQVSAVGSTVGSCYGFLCGAYMPLSQFSSGLRGILSCLPGTYGTSLLRSHCIGGAISAMESASVPADAISALRDACDINVYFSGDPVGTGVSSGRWKRLKS